MNQLSKQWAARGTALAALLSIALWTGCGPLNTNTDPGLRSTAPVAGSPAANVGSSTPNIAPVNTTIQPRTPSDLRNVLPPLGVGDLVIINFLDLPPSMQIPECKERIRDDGTLMLPYQVSVSAAGKTVTQLQDAIHDAYVPKLYNRLTISVKTEERVYYVGGEVKNSGRFPYLSEITVLRAIDSAGGFTDFARKTEIELHRANGEFHRVDWKKAKKNPKLDLVVYPNDRINVPQRLY